MAIVEFDETLERAVRAALEPWSLQIVTAAGPTPGATAPLTNELAREIARTKRVDAVVWISEHEQSYALWIYDVSTDHVVTRPLSRPPPFDEPTAAAVALSVKTLLRYSTTAPESERFGAVPRSVTPATPAPPTAIALPAIPKPTAVQRETIDAPYFEVESVAALRGGRTNPSAYEPRLGLGVAWWPSAGWFAGTVGVSIGTGIEVNNKLFQGRMIDPEATLAARTRSRIGRGLQLSAAVGPALHITLLDGTVLSEEHRAQVWRVAPSLRGELQADWRFTRWLRLGARGAGFLMLATQRYTVENEAVLTVSRLAFDVGLVLGVGVVNSRVISIP